MLMSTFAYKERLLTKKKKKLCEIYKQDEEEFFGERIIGIE